MHFVPKLTDFPKLHALEFRKQVCQVLLRVAFRGILEQQASFQGCRSGDGMQLRPRGEREVHPEVKACARHMFGHEVCPIWQPGVPRRCVG